MNRRFPFVCLTAAIALVHASAPVEADTYPRQPGIDARHYAIRLTLDEPTTSPINQLVYQKGGWTLHMLRGLIGTEPFWRGIRIYYQRHMNGLASTMDLRRVMEEVSGQDLGWFFAEWLTRSGVPQVSGEWRYDAANKQIVATVRQTQAGEPYRFSIGIGVSAAADAPPAIHQLDVKEREATLRIPADAEPAAVVLDPGVWLLAEFGTFTKAGS